MNATTTAIFVTAKKSLTWSIVLSALMILAGILAIFIPPVAGLAVTIFVGWLLVFSFCVCVADSNVWRVGLRTPAWHPLPGRRFLLAMESRGWSGFAHTWLGALPCRGSYLGIYSRLSPSAAAGFRLAFFSMG